MTSPHAAAPEADAHQTPAEAMPERSLRLTGQPVGTTFISLYVLAIIGLWLAVLPPTAVALSLRVAELDPEHKSSSLALVTGVGAIFALVANPVCGRLSDASASRFGRRRPFMVGGILLATLALVVVGTAPNIPTMLAGWCVLQIGVNAALAALIAVLPDRIPEHRRGRVSGLMGMTNQVATVAGTFLIQLTGTHGLGMFLVPALIGVVLVVVFACHLREVPQSRAERRALSWADIPRSMWINPLRHTDFAWAFLSRFLVWTGKAFLLTYKTYFLMDHLGYDADDAARILSWTMLLLAIAIVVGSNVAGWLSDLLGRRKVFIGVAALLFAAGMVVIAFSNSVTGFLVGVGVSGIGQGVYVGIDYALVASVLPDSKSEAAKGMGLFNIANALPQSVAPAVAPVFLAIGGAGGEDNYTALYLAAAAFALLGAFAVRFVRGAR
ncbi:MFS transporter [Streptomyces sp. SID8379]|uniref:MFS transporter n=1 Tax=unclassified Streptomyces TaxID=2593676 RepID=UPI00039D8279|nr:MULTISPECIES: MFS transporter [unclassified Streptomyces]MYW63335.1 MFS transporter [Streptomyces sp. SID8379]